MTAAWPALVQQCWLARLLLALMLLLAWMQLVVLVAVLALGMEPVQLLQTLPVPEAEPELTRRSARESDHPKIHAGWS
jgi:hypothetical protein